MCIAQRTIVNRRYVKAAGTAARAEVLFRHCPDLYLLVDCGRCLPCQKKRANVWRQRLVDEFNYLVARYPDKKHKVYFVTLTIAPQYYHKDFDQSKFLIRKFRERYRKLYGKSLRFWITSEYGEKRGRLHFHGIFFDPLFTPHELRDLWKYGRVDMSVVGCSLKNPEQDPTKGIAYVTKYITKTVDSWFIDWDKRSHVLCSPGIGLGYTLDPHTQSWHDQSGGLFFRVTNDGRFPQALPRYYIQKLFSPYDLYKRSLVNIRRLHSPAAPPFVVGKHVFHDFAPYVDFVNLVGGKVTLLSTQLAGMSHSDKLKYYEQSSK